MSDSLFRFDWLDHDELAHGSPVLENDLAGNLGEKSVVFAAANIEAGFYTRAPLTHDDRAAGDDLSAECFESKPLGV